MSFKGSSTLVGLRLIRKEETIIKFDLFPFTNGKRHHNNEDKFTDSLALPVDTDGVDQMTPIPPLTKLL